MKEAHVVEFSPHPPNGVGGWDWYPERAAAKKRVLELMDEEYPYDVLYHILRVPDIDDNAAITDWIADNGLLDS